MVRSGPAGLVLDLAAIGAGAVAGAWLRWLLTLWLNPVHRYLPLGTWAANLLGGLLIGAALAWFARHPGLDAAWRLAGVTGFLGALTTFSAFTAESLVLLQSGRYGWALLHTGAHVVGCLAAAAAGHHLVSIGAR
jgi:CrcB protein